MDNKAITIAAVKCALVLLLELGERDNICNPFFLKVAFDAAQVSFPFQLVVSALDAHDSHFTWPNVSEEVSVTHDPAC